MRNLLLGACAALALTSGSAFAANHSMYITEVYTGSATAPDAKFVELTMFFAGQNFVTGTRVHFFSASGGDAGFHTFAADVASGADDRSILLATAEAATEFNITPDVTLPALPDLTGAGGAACFSGSGDCVAWGTYPTSGTPATGYGTPVNAVTGITTGTSIHRDEGGGGWQSQDDSNDSSADFATLVTPTPENNAGTTGVRSVVDAGTVDAGTADAGTADAGAADAGTVDAGTVDAGTDAGSGTDAGTTPTDAGSSTDAGADDAGTGGVCLAEGATCDAAASTCCAGLTCDTHEGTSTCAPAHDHDEGGCSCGVTSASTFVFFGLALLALVGLRRRAVR